MPTFMADAGPRVSSDPPPSSSFTFLGERLWLDFVNTDEPHRSGSHDAIHDFDALMTWLESATAMDAERASGIRRRAQQQPTGASAALLDARRVRAALRRLAEYGAFDPAVRLDALAEINRVLTRSAGTRRVELREDGTFARTFIPGGDAFAGLMIPIVESAADALILGELPRVRPCADQRCRRVFYDATRNGRRRWCDMAVCGNRAKAARHRKRVAALAADTAIQADSAMSAAATNGDSPELESAVTLSGAAEPQPEAPTLAPTSA